MTDEPPILLTMPTRSTTIYDSGEVIVVEAVPEPSDHAYRHA